MEDIIYYPTIVVNKLSVILQKDWDNKSVTGKLMIH